MKRTFNINNQVSYYLNEKSPYSDFSNYFHFLISNMDEISKSHSGVIKVVFSPVYGADNVLVELYGYDTLTLSSTEKIEGTEFEVKRKIIELFEKERFEILAEKPEDK